MSMTPTEPHPTHRRGSTTFIVWAVALGFVVIYHYARSFLGPLRGVLVFCAFLSCLVFIAITLYWIALAIRWMLRALFWRVGRRLFLSYVLIGALPFFLIGVLLLTIGYMIAGVMSHAALRGERQATLGQMESAALEYGLTGHHPPDALSSLEIYDTANDSGKKLPEWLREATFSGMVWRGKSPLLVSSRQFEGGRTVVFVQPLDREWADQLEEKTGMITRARWDQEGDHDDDDDDSRAPSKSIIISRSPISHAATVELDDDNANQFGKLAWHSIGRKIVWADVSDLTDWDTGETRNDRQLVTLIVNPVSSLFQFYFGSSSGVYLRALLQGILAITVMLLIIYMFAAMFAAVLIFSISRAVNRIEKGTKAVERGDFSYRINMKPHNQLGEMAQSFDRMTESISTLLVTVAEKERLQSEIEIAASIQRNLLPKEGPQFRGVSFSAHFEPTASIGGDYYDVFNLDKSRLAVAIGDVSGHGLSTGLVMAMVKAAITTLVEEGADETSLFRRLNELVFRSTERRAFMTLAFTIFDLEHGTIRHTNAGHLYPYLLRDGQPAISIESPSLPLGVRSELITHTVEVDLQEGDAIVYLSDGIVEAQNENGDPLGFDALESLLGNAPDRSPSAIRDAILTAVAHHCGTRPADDDRTVMVLRFEQFRIPIRPTIAAAAVEEPVTT